MFVCGFALVIPPPSSVRLIREQATCAHSQLTAQNSRCDVQQMFCKSGHPEHGLGSLLTAQQVYSAQGRGLVSELGVQARWTGGAVVGQQHVWPI